MSITVQDYKIDINAIVSSIVIKEYESVDEDIRNSVIDYIMRKITLEINSITTQDIRDYTVNRTRALMAGE